MPAPQIHTAELLAADIQNPDVFEAARRDAYLHAEDQRAARLGGLLGETMLKGGEVSVADEALDQVTRIEKLATEAGAHLQDVSDRILARVTPNAKEKGVQGYAVEMDGDGTVQNVYRKTFLPQDSRVLSTAKNTSKRAPYGPRQNGSSYRSGAPVDPRTRH